MSIQGNNLPVYATSPQNYSGSLSGSSLGTLGADTNGTVVYTAGANGSRVYGLFLSSNDTAANNIFLYIKATINSTTYYSPISQLNIPINAGNVASTPCVDALSPTNTPGLPFDGTGKPYIELAPNATLKVSLVAATTTGKTVYIAAMGADY
jgi:hypothetical protein